MNEEMTSKLGPIGVAGCGRMGAPMARAMVRAGFDVAGLDVLPAESFGDLAPRMMGAADFTATRHVVLSVVRDVAQTEELLFDIQALVSRRPSAILYAEKVEREGGWLSTAERPRAACAVQRACAQGWSRYRIE